MTASCKTVTYTYNFYGAYSSYSSSSFHHGGHTSSYHSSHEEGEAEGPSHQPRHSNGFGSPQRGDALEREGGGHGGGGRGGGVGRGRGGRGGRDPGGGGGDGGRGAGRGGPSSASPAAPPSAPMFPAAWESESYWSTLTDDSTHTDDDGEDYSYLFHQEYSHTETFVSVQAFLCVRWCIPDPSPGVASGAQEERRRNPPVHCAEDGMSMEVYIDDQPLRKTFPTGAKVGSTGLSLGVL